MVISEERVFLFPGERPGEHQPMRTATLRTPLRWAGSKKKQISKLLSIMSSPPHKTIEPFAGSACFTLRAGAPNVVISDINIDLISFYTDLRSNTAELFEKFNALDVNQDTYYKSRTTFNDLESCVLKSAIFLYLNRYGFNGIYRVNKAGKYNVPWGGEKSGAAPSLEELQSVADHLKAATIISGDFEVVVRRELTPGTLVYLDPPYARNEVRVFREYHADSFTTLDWERLVELVTHIDASGAYFILSYAGDPLLVKALSKWEVGRLEVTRNVGGFASSRRKHSEFIASNYKA